MLLVAERWAFHRPSQRIGTGSLTSISFQRPRANSRAQRNMRLPRTRGHRVGAAARRGEGRPGFPAALPRSNCFLRKAASDASCSGLSSPPSHHLASQCLSRNHMQVSLPSSTGAPGILQKPCCWQDDAKLETKNGHRLEKEALPLSARLDNGMLRAIPKSQPLPVPRKVACGYRSSCCTRHRAFEARVLHIKLLRSTYYSLFTLSTYLSLPSFLPRSD